VATTTGRTGKRASTQEPASDPQRLVELYRRLVLVRTFEEECNRSFRRGKIGGYLHLYTGEEAVAAGFLEGYRPGDRVITSYRDHAHALLMGCDPAAVMAELYGREGGLVGGKGGSMHLFDIDRGLWGGFGIVGGHIPLGVGFGYALRYQQTEHICQLYLGDGAMQTGAFHEAANLAGLWGQDGRCPVLFIVENNQYGMGTAVARESAVTDLAAKFDAYGIEHEKVDGMDLEAVIRCGQRVSEQVRESGRPYAVEAVTYRTAPHGAADFFERYRTKEEVAEWRKRDPITLLRDRLSEAGEIDDDMVEEINADARREVQRAVEFADSSPEPAVERLYDGVYADSHQDADADADTAGGETKTYREALREALVTELDRDENVVLIGEDIGVYGGTQLVTDGLYDRYGAHRVIDTPISENGFVGAAIGMAMTGMRPIVEMMTWNFSFLAVDQIIQNAAKVRYFSNGQVSVPLVIRGPNGGGVQLSAQHTHSLESFYGHFPGLKVVAPVSPADAKGMMLTAVRDDDCVIFLEAGALYGTKGEVEAGDHAVPFGQARIARAGDDVTLISYGRQVQLCCNAADMLAEDGIEVEVIDLRSLRPLDADTLVASVQKTHRAVAVQEQWRFYGVASEVAAIIQDQAFDYLDAPVERVSGAEVPGPYAHNLEIAAFPSEQQVVDAVHRVLYQNEG
jgi:2-oxoisovalerate dehydrogenase E1 component